MSDYQLRDYQEKALQELFFWFKNNATGNPIVSACVGAGKSILIAEFCKRVMESYPNQRILMAVASRELVAQNYEKLRTIYPQGNMGLYSAGLGKKNPHAKIVFATIGSVYDKAMQTGAFNICLIDECFPSGTKIKTPGGYSEIQQLKSGDKIISAIGVSEVITTFKKSSNNLVEVLFSNGTRIKCTEDHPFFTASGWTKASELEGKNVIREEDMSALWQGVQATNIALRSKREGGSLEKKNVLLSTMFRSKCTKNGKVRKINYRKRKEGTANKISQREYLESTNANPKESVSFLQSRFSAEHLSQQHRGKIPVGKKEFLQHILFKEIQQSNGRFINKIKNVRNAEIYWTQATDNRGERKGINQASRNNAEDFRFRMESRISNKNIRRTKKWRISELLQSGYRERAHKDSYRTGRAIASRKEKGAGYKEGCLFVGTRVESVTHTERDCDTDVFNLHVSGHPSYFANGNLVHNCHNVSRKETGMYRQMIADYTRLNPNFRVIGFTGTPFRGDGVLLTEGDQALFTDIASKITMRKLLDEGYLSPLVTHKVETKVVTTNVSVSRMTGDYNISELSSAVDKIEITRAAVREIIAAGQDRKSWLIYGITIEHCEHIHEELEKSGIHGAMVHSKTPKAQRDRILADFKSHKIRYVVNVLCLSVGFDHPATDLIALLRPTKSKVLYVQISGRGLRTHPEKENCLWLDFSSTTESLGEVDMVKGRHENPPGNAPTKKCGGKDKWEEGCDATVPASTAFCPHCGFDFEMPEPDKYKDLRHKSSTADIISVPEIPTIFQVSSWQCKPHAKLGSPASLQVSYFSSNPVGNLAAITTTNSHREWICFDHQGFARRKAESWWLKFGGRLPYPVDVREAIERFSELTKPSEIQLKKEGKYYVITNHYFEQQPTIATAIPEIHHAIAETPSDTVSANDVRPSVSSAFSRALSAV